jgi:hypothetical protein
MHALLVRQAISLLLALVVLAIAAGNTAFATHRSPAQNCQKAINEASQEYMEERLEKLFKCGEKKFKKKKFKKDKDITACTTKVKSEKVELENKSCPAKVLTDPPSEEALGITRCVTRAPGCMQPVDAASMAECIRCSHQFETDCLFRTVYDVSTPECETP